MQTEGSAEDYVINHTMDVAKGQHDFTQDVDHGYAWVILFVAFCIHFIMGGFAYTTGVFYVEFLVVFNESRGTTAWISSLLYGFLCTAGPIGSILISQWGCRYVFLCGTVISSSSLFATAFANNIYVIFVTLGIITGIGYGLTFTAAVVVVSYHFQKYRTLAMGISIAGGSIGIMIYPWISRALLMTFAWRGALIIISGINLHIAVLAMLVPLKSPLQQRQPDHTNVKKSWRTSLRLHIFKSPAYNLLSINSMFFNFGLFVVFTHISAYALSLHLGQNVADFALSLLGIAGLLGRIGLGALGQLQSVNVPMLYVASYIIAGLATIVCGLVTTSAGLLTSIFIFGLFSAAYGPLLCEATIIVSGSEDFNHAYGYMMLYQGIGTILGPPVAGMLYDFTNLYKASFFLGGCALIFSSLIMVPHFCFSKRFRLSNENIQISEKTLVQTSNDESVKLSEAD